MNSDADEFAKALLAQEPTLASPEFNEQRTVLLQRLAQAEARERRARGITLFAAIIGSFIVVAIFYAAFKHIENTAPFWVIRSLAATVILVPVLLLLLGGLYFLRHRRALVKTRRALNRAALAELPRQIAALQKEINALRNKPN